MDEDTEKMEAEGEGDANESPPPKDKSPPKAGVTHAVGRHSNKLIRQRERTIELHENTIEAQKEKIASLDQRLKSMAVNYSKQLTAKDKEILKLRKLLATKDGQLAAKHEELTHLQRECIELMEGKVQADEDKNDEAERKLEEEAEAERNPLERYAGRNPLGQLEGRPSTSLRESGHAPMPVDTADRFYCVVCKLEENWRKEDGLRDAHGKNARSQRNMCMCSSKDCQLVCHAIPMGHQRKIFDIEGLRGLSCFEIAHSEMCKGLWVVSERAGQSITRKLHPNDKRYKEDGTGGIKQRLPSYSIKRCHPVYKHLQQAYGRGPEKRQRKRKADNYEDIAEEEAEGQIAEEEEEGQILC